MNGTTCFGWQRYVANSATLDGHRSIRCGGDGCDDADADANRYPGRMEVCDALDHDEDCDPMTFGHRDADGDTHDDDACCNVDTTSVRRCGNDCDDTLPTVGPPTMPG